MELKGLTVQQIFSLPESLTKQVAILAKINRKDFTAIILAQNPLFSTSFSGQINAMNFSDFVNFIAVQFLGQNISLDEKQVNLQTDGSADSKTILQLIGQKNIDFRKL